MSRLCERPGCSDPASVAYGMRAEDLVFWLAAIVDSREIDGGVLCRRHADTMVVPRGWTLDDLRDPDLHLFRPPAEQATTKRRRRRSSRHDEADAEQLTLDSTGEIDAPTAADLDVDDTTDRSAAAEPGADDESEDAWMPNFDADDDLDGLLSARSPLLSRAFRGDDRAR